MKKGRAFTALPLMVAMVSVQTTIAFAADWRLITTDRDNNSIYYDAESVKKSDDRVTIWQRVVLGTPRNDVTETRVNLTCDCTTETITMHYAYGYNDTGVVVHQEKLDIPEIKIVPESVGEIIYKLLCHPKPQTETLKRRRS